MPQYKQNNTQYTVLPIRGAAPKVQKPLAGVARGASPIVAQGGPASRAKLSHDVLKIHRATTGLDAPEPPVPRGPAIVGGRNLQKFELR